MGKKIPSDAGAESANAREFQRRRHQELIRACIREDGGEISFVNVQALYERWYPDSEATSNSSTVATPKPRKKGPTATTRLSHFRDDCKTLLKHFKDYSEAYLAPFFLPVPEIEYDDTNAILKIHSGRRPIAEHKNDRRGDIPKRRALARYVCQSFWPGEGTLPLFPRKGRIFAGHGGTICILFHELLCELRERVPELTVYTPSFEVAGLLYYLHQGAGTPTGIRFGENLRIDRGMGSILPYALPDNRKLDIRELDVAIISCHSMYYGTISSNADVRTHSYSEPYLAKAKRIVMVAEHWKIGRTAGDPFVIPGLGEKPVLLVTDADEALVKQHIPDGMVPLIFKHPVSAPPKTENPTEPGGGVGSADESTKPEES